MRAGGRCEMTGEITNEAHHVFFGAVAWQLRYNPNYFICLAGGPHRLDPAAPHVDNEAFLKIIRNDSRFVGKKHIEIILSAIDEPTPIAVKPDWNLLYRALKAELVRYEATSWMDDTQIALGRICA